MKKNEGKSKQLFSQEMIKKKSRCRIIQRNLIYVQLTSESLADKSILGKFEYFGQYGKITKIVINKKDDNNNCESNHSDTKSKDASSSAFAYITYSKPEEASLAILAVDNFQLNGSSFRVLYGTTKYCYNFLNGIECFNKEMCTYLHGIANEEDIVGANFRDHHKIAIKTGDIFHPDVKKKILFSNPKKKTVLPKAITIYQKEFVMQCDPEQVIKPTLPVIRKNSSISSGNGSTDCERTSLTKEHDIDTAALQAMTKRLKNDKENLYHHKSQSRFSFAQSNEINCDNNIPEYIIELIDKKAARFSFFKNIRVQFPILEYLEMKFDNASIQKGADEKEKDSWFEFIKTNTEVNEYSK